MKNKDIRRDKDALEDLWKNEKVVAAILPNGDLYFIIEDLRNETNIFQSYSISIKGEVKEGITYQFSQKNLKTSFGEKVIEKLKGDETLTKRGLDQYLKKWHSKNEEYPVNTGKGFSNSMRISKLHLLKCI